MTSSCSDKLEGEGVAIYASDDRKLFCRYCGQVQWRHKFLRGVGFLCTPQMGDK